MKHGFSENVSVDEGVNANGIRTILHFEGDTLTVQRQYDAQPLLEHARAMREAQDGQRWGNGKFIGTIPMAEYAKFLAIPGKEDRRKAIHAYLREHQMLVGFSRWLKR